MCDKAVPAYPRYEHKLSINLLLLLVLNVCVKKIREIGSQISS